MSFDATCTRSDSPVTDRTLVRWVSTRPVRARTHRWRTARGIRRAALAHDSAIDALWMPASSSRSARPTRRGISRS